jgi:hypothetical protein
MGFKSEAHRRKMQELEDAGKVKKGTTKAFEDDTPKEKLPERKNGPQSFQDLEKIRIKKSGK